MHLGIHFMRTGKVTGICSQRLALTLAKHKGGDIRRKRQPEILVSKPVFLSSKGDVLNTASLTIHVDL